MHMEQVWIQWTKEKTCSSGIQKTIYHNGSYLYCNLERDDKSFAISYK